MTALPVISGREAIKALGRAGFTVVRQRGSHVRLEKRTEDRMVNYRLLKSMASCFIDPTFRVDLNPTTLTDGHVSRQHLWPCDLPQEFIGVCLVWFGRFPPYHFPW